MFPNCIDCFGHQNRETTQQTNKQKPRKEINKLKMGKIVRTTNHYLTNGQKEDPELFNR